MDGSNGAKNGWNRIPVDSRSASAFTRAIASAMTSRGVKKRSRGRSYLSIQARMKTWSWADGFTSSAVIPSKRSRDPTLAYMRAMPDGPARLTPCLMQI